jgi:hypothetical protein
MQSITSQRLLVCLSVDFNQPEKAAMLVRRAAVLRGVLAAAVGNMRLKAGEGATRAAEVALKLVPGSGTCKVQGMLLP